MAADSQRFPHASAPSAPRYWPLGELLLARVREFLREPEAVFWVYGFPILMTIALGTAFRHQPVERVSVVIEQGPLAATIRDALAADRRFDARIETPAGAHTLLRSGKRDVLVRGLRWETPAGQGGEEAIAQAAQLSGATLQYVFDVGRPTSVAARSAVDDALQRAAGRRDVVQTTEQTIDEPGGRYIDFLVPGLLGMSLMGGGLWGVGYVTVDLRIRKLLKRFLATPMKRSHFLAGIILSRLLFMVPEVLIILVFAWLLFDVRIYGSVIAVIVLIVLGALTFAGIGLLVASRARTLESVSGLMNLVMVPMWIFSGIFFSRERFPEAIQPLISLLPLTPLNDALRAVMQDGTTLWALGPQLGILTAYAVGCFALALRLFRWN